MVSSVTSQSNHYEVLGLTPAASDHEIAKAFAAQMRIFRLGADSSVARLAQLSVAYETLRDPAKRRAYDASLGLEPDPVPVPRQDPTPFTWAAPWERQTRRVAHRLTPSTPPPQQAPRAAEPRAEREVGSFIAASLREPVKPSEAEAAPLSEPQPVPQPVWVENDGGDRDDRSIDGNRASLAAGVFGLGILALAVSLPGENIDRLPAGGEPAEQTVTVGLPPATPVPQTVAAAPAPVPTVAEQPRAELAPPAQTAAPAEPAAPPEASAEQAPAETPNAEPAVAETAPAETPAEPAPEPVPAAAATRLPLPDATVARTIQRIGYPCGRVVSTTGVDGAAGVFKVTCSSGHAYQATPVRGRYHFRRWGRQ